MTADSLRAEQAYMDALLMKALVKDRSAGRHHIRGRSEWRHVGAGRKHRSFRINVPAVTRPVRPRDHGDDPMMTFADFTLSDLATVRHFLDDNRAVCLRIDDPKTGLRVVIRTPANPPLVAIDLRRALAEGITEAGYAEEVAA